MNQLHSHLVKHVQSSSKPGWPLVSNEGRFMNPHYNHIIPIQSIYGIIYLHLVDFYIKPWCYVGKYTSPMDAMGITICMIFLACLLAQSSNQQSSKAWSSWWLLTGHPAWWYLGAASGDTTSGSTGSRICRTGEVSCDDTLTDVFSWKRSDE